MVMYVSINYDRMVIFMCNVLMLEIMSQVDFDIKEKDTECTPLMVAAECGHEKVCKSAMAAF